MKYFFIAILALSHSLAKGQNGYTVNDITGDFPISKIINHSSSASTFQQLKEKLVVVDFFGTWCVPCVKALPHLTALQQKYKNEIKIVLVSDEPQAKLESFIKRQANFLLPVVVDEPGTFIKLFQPPSYPYTVIVGKNGKVLAIPSQEEMTEENISKWLEMQNSNLTAAEKTMNKKDSAVVSSSNNTQSPALQKSSNKLVQLSQEFMYAAKTGEAIESFLDKMKNISYEELRTGLKNDDERKAFWINAYNGYIQARLRKNPEAYNNRGPFFKDKEIEIAGKKFSLDDIEHGILRKSKVKWSLGYITKPFLGKTERQLRVNKLDYRIHFALDCGAKSCPPIAFYEPTTIDKQLDVATAAYLKSEVVYDANKNTIGLPAIMGWFRSDFGGKIKMLRLLKDKGIIPATANPTIHFNDYDWELHLNNFQN